jgi:hypothetical protein
LRLTSLLNLPAPGRRQTLYVVFDFAESCVFSKQSLGPLYCNSFTHTIARTVHGNRAPLIPKLRGQFAEFLNEGSHSRLRIFSSPTCVGLRYGYPLLSLEAFLGSVALPALRVKDPRHSTSRNVTLRICLENPPTCLNPHVQSWARLASCVPPS